MEQKNHGSPSFINIAVLLLFAIVIVVTSSVSTYFFLSSKSNEQPSTTPKELGKVAKYQSEKHILKIRVTNWIGKRSIENLSVEVIWRDNHKLIYKNKTDKNGIVEFSLPTGFYYYRIAEKTDMGYRSGEHGINLEKDTEVELRVVLMPPQ